MFGNGRVLGPVDDRGERAVDVEQQPGLRRLLRDPLDQVRRVHPHRENRRVSLVLIGLAAGFFSALFGVGGGIIVVPLLLLAGRWQERPAMATSLAAIGIIALAGTVSYGFHGELKPGAARDGRPAGRRRSGRGYGAPATSREPYALAAVRRCCSWVSA